MDEIRQRPGAPFAIGFAGSGSGIRTLDGASLVALAGDGQITDAIGALATEAERARRYGITAGEFERTKADVLRGFESAVAEQDNQPSRNLAGAYVQSFLQDEPVVAPDDQFRLVQALVPTITLDEVNAVAEELVAAENRTVVVTAPERDGLAVPTEADLRATLAAVGASEITAYEDDTVDGPLVATMPTAGQIVDEEMDDDLGTTTWTLSNGASVVLKPTTFKADEVWLSATSPGGTSLLSDDQVAVAGGAAGYIGSSGAGEFDEVALGKKLAGQIVQVRPSISGDSEGFSGRAAPGDLETLFQLVYLYTTAPRKDANAFESSIAQTRAFLSNQVTTPRAAFQDTLSQTLNNYHPPLPVAQPVPGEPGPGGPRPGVRVLPGPLRRRLGLHVRAGRRLRA